MKNQQMSFAELLARLEEFSWKGCVYLSDPKSLKLETICIIVDDNEEELGSDGFTPLVAELLGMCEFLSIQDILMVREYLGNLGIKSDEHKETYASKYYFERDSYPSKLDLDEHR